MNLAEDARVLLEDWNRCHGAFYQVEESDLRWNLTAQDWVHYAVRTIADVPVLTATATAAGEAAGISAKTLWLSLYGEIPSRRQENFIHELIALARLQGKTRVTLGGDEFHFLSGVPSDESAGESFVRALAAAGFSGAEAVDFVGPLRGAMMDSYIGEAESGGQAAGLSLTEVGPERESALAEFLVREFPGRWEREFRFWKNRPDTGRAFWNLLQDSGGKAVGFSRLAFRGRIPDLQQGWNPGALKLPLGKARSYADSCLGPIGISASERGRGAGKILLGLSLKKLRQIGAEDLCIDWTHAYNYYTPLGVRVSRKFHSMWKDI